jgi:glycosyltransferase involved in cell wall biosynthesis
MLVTHIITDLNDGGAEAVLYRLCGHDSEGTHVVISLMDEGKYSPLLRRAGVEVHSLGMPRGRLTQKGLSRLWRLLRQLRPEAVQTWMYHANLVGGLMARMAGILNVYWGVRHTALEAGSSKKSTIWVARLCAWLSLCVPRRIVYCAQKAREEHVGLGYDDRKSRVIYNGYDLSQFSADDEGRRRLRKDWDVSEDEVLLGMVGRFDPQKDHPNLFGALAKLKGKGHAVRCALVGKGLDRANASLMGSITGFGLSPDRELLLLGQRNDISTVMNALDIHVLSSAYGEAFPNVLAEAMACGTPCITTDVGDAALIVGETGWVVPPRDRKSLAHRILSAIKLSQDQPGWKIRQMSCRKRIDTEFSIERMVCAYRDVWEGQPGLI